MLRYTLLSLRRCRTFRPPSHSLPTRRTFRPRFAHASEHFENSAALGQKVDDYLRGRITASGLPAGVRPLTPVLDAIKADLRRRGLVFAGSRHNNRRHERIHTNFNLSRNLHLRAGRFTAQDKGHFHVGAMHAAKQPIGGRANTTTQRLIADGLNVGVVRLAIDRTGTTEQQDGGFVISAFETISVVPLAGGSRIDLLPILRRVAAGVAFACPDLGSSGSPFLRVKPAHHTGSRHFAAFFQALIFLP